MIGDLSMVIWDKIMRGQSKQTFDPFLWNSTTCREKSMTIIWVRLISRVTMNIMRAIVMGMLMRIMLMGRDKIMQLLVKVTDLV